VEEGIYQHKPPLLHKGGALANHRRVQWLRMQFTHELSNVIEKGVEDGVLLVHHGSQLPFIYENIS